MIYDGEHSWFEVKRYVKKYGLALPFASWETSLSILWSNLNFENLSSFQLFIENVTETCLNSGYSNNLMQALKQIFTITIYKYLSGLVWYCLAELHKDEIRKKWSRIRNKGT